MEVDDLADLFLTLKQQTQDDSEQAMYEAVDQALRETIHAELDRKALWAFVYAREKLTFDKRLADIRVWVKGYREGQRGIMVSSTEFGEERLCAKSVETCRIVAFRIQACITMKRVFVQSAFDSRSRSHSKLPERKIALHWLCDKIENCWYAFTGPRCWAGCIGKCCRPSFRPVRQRTKHEMPGDAVSQCLTQPTTCLDSPPNPEHPS